VQALSNAGENMPQRISESENPNPHVEPLQPRMQS